VTPLQAYFGISGLMGLVFLVAGFLRGRDGVPDPTALSLILLTVILGLLTGVLYRLGIAAGRPFLRPFPGGHVPVRGPDPTFAGISRRNRKASRTSAWGPPPGGSPSPEPTAPAPVGPSVPERSLDDLLARALGEPPAGGAGGTTVTDPAAAAPPDLEIGWHLEAGDPYAQVYWDGTGWTARMRWDGSAWVSEP
jgi:hypothetical protein